MYACMHVYMYAYMHVCMYTCMRVCTSAHMHACTIDVYNRRAGTTLAHKGRVRFGSSVSRLSYFVSPPKRSDDKSLGIISKGEGRARNGKQRKAMENQGTQGG